MKPKKYDFSGWATRYNKKCADGRTITHHAFLDCDGLTVPLLFYHDHDHPAAIVGNGTLEHRENEGMYMYGSFNNTDMGKLAKEYVQHGDITYLSIYANNLKQNGGDVMHGIIREVSLVLASANPDARIDVPVIEHSIDGDTYFEDADECFITTGERIELYHSDEGKPDTEEKKGDKPVAEGKEKTVGDVFDEFTDDQKKVVAYMISEAVKKARGGDTDGDDDEEDSKEKDKGDSEMKHNAFDNDTPQTALSHDDMKKIFADAKRLGTLSAAVEANMQEGGVLQHALYNDDGTEATYGIANIETLFPEPKELNNPPKMIDRHTEWVSVVMNGVHRTPFSRIRTSFANVTMDEARAKGYIKGNRKDTEVFSLLRRSIDPQTVYKKQQMDRDDIIDITSFDVVAWIKGEMRIKLEEEIARAILIGDGRLVTDPDHISHDHVKPVVYDDDLFNIKAHVTAGVDDGATTKNMIVAFIRAMEDYEGSGNLTLFMPQKWITEALLLEDGFGRPLYANVQALANKMQVNRIVKVPLMKNFTYDTNQTLMGVALDLNDYNVGADKGGAINMFDDFDIDYNQYKYLIETRISGMLTEPFSAITLILGGSAATYSEATVTSSSNPKASGWYVKEGDLYVRAVDTTPVVIGKDASDNDIYRTYYAKS